MSHNESNDLESPHANAMEALFECLNLLLDGMDIIRFNCDRYLMW